MIFTFVGIRNEFLGPLIYLNFTEKVIQPGLSMLIAPCSSEYNLITAASVIDFILVLIVFLSLQKYFVPGVATSGQS